MRGVLVFLILTGLPIGLAQPGGRQSQRPLPAAQSTSKLLTLTEVLRVEAFSRTRWALAAMTKEPEYQPKGRENAARDIDRFINEKPTRDERRGLIAEHRLLTAHRNALVSLVRSGSDPLLYTEAPVRFALKDDTVTLLLTSISSNNVYNTRLLDAKQRATKEIQATLLPAMRQFSRMDSAVIKSYGIIVVYGSKDFSDELSLEAEAVALVASAEKCRKLIAAELSEEDFVETADVYLMDRDTVGTVRKIRISIDGKGK